MWESFFHGKSRKQKKESGTNFALLCQSRIMIGQIKKTYLHKPIKVLQFLPSPLKKKKKSRQHSWMCIRITRINNFNLKKKKKDKKTWSKRNERRKENVCEKSNGIQWYRLRICSVFFWFTWSSIEFLLTVHINLMFICNERNHSICYTRTAYEVHTFTGP